VWTTAGSDGGPAGGGDAGAMSSRAGEARAGGPGREASDELVCEFCGAAYRPDDGRRCTACDVPSCEHCATPDDGSRCPECEGAILPPQMEPMLARLSTLPTGDGWRYEFKWDGVRCLAYWDCCDLRLDSRRLNDITARYPELGHIAEGLGVPAVLDGEIVALDENGRPSFGRLQSRVHLSPDKARRAVAHVPVFYFVFDLLHLDGESLLDRPYMERRAALESLPFDDPRLQVPPNDADGGVVLAAAREHGLEGVVAKRVDGRYKPGRRSGAWRKVKLVRAQEFVIAGWTPQKDSDHRVGSLLLGTYDERGRLRYAGRVGSGFSDDDHLRLLDLLEPLRTPVDPFARGGQADTASASRRSASAGTRYVVPELVAHVEYRRWPEGGHLQQTAFKGLRSDVPPGDVVRERQEGG